MAFAQIKNRRRKDYGYLLEYRTRWCVKLQFRDTNSNNVFPGQTTICTVWNKIFGHCLVKSRIHFDITIFQILTERRPHEQQYL